MCIMIISQIISVQRSCTGANFDLMYLYTRYIILFCKYFLKILFINVDFTLSCVFSVSLVYLSLDYYDESLGTYPCPPAPPCTSPCPPAPPCTSPCPPGHPCRYACPPAGVPLCLRPPARRIHHSVPSLLEQSKIKIKYRSFHFLTFYAKLFIEETGWS